MNLLYASAFDIASAIKRRHISAAETLEFFLARVEEHNAGINAVVALDIERARERARQADDAAKNGEDRGPLHGTPLTIKDALCTEGLVTAGGMPEYRHNVPATNAIGVQRYIDAGAIVFGKTNVPFMSADLQSYNDLYGVTNNPWNPERTCGGSSGGAGAAVAAGLTPLELGSDIGGSIRTPSHFNGVFGHKPSYGIVPQRGHLPPGETALMETDLSVVGPIGTSPADLEKALDILVGPPPEAARAYTIDLPPARTADPAQLRVAVWSDDALCPVDTDIAAAIEAAADTLESLGAAVDREARPDFRPRKNHLNYSVMLSAAIGAGMPDSVFETMRELAENTGPDDTGFAALQARGVASSYRDWARRFEQRQRLRASWAAFFRDYDVLLCPCAHLTAFPHDHSPDMIARGHTVNGREREYLDILFWAGLTLNAGLPATATPIATSSEGLPIGVQVVADYLEDRTALAVAKILEAHHRAFVPPPGYT